MSTGLVSSEVWLAGGCLLAMSSHGPFSVYMHPHVGLHDLSPSPYKVTSWIGLEATLMVSF